MIDLSHLTEEEQGVIMTVLRRDAELKKAEEERIRKLETILNSDTQPDYQLKYLTGEWFYEAKSRRHMDKIHGSEIILASMKQRKASGLEGSLRLERFKAPSSRGSDTAAPPKPARSLEATQPQEMNDPDKENLNSAIRSPRTPRHNPFNRASLIVVDPPENPDVLPKTRDQDSCETEPAVSPPKKAGEGGQTVGGSVTSECSSVGFRPVPKKRTFLSRRSSSQTDSNGLGSDTQVNPVITPAPRRSIRRGSSGSSHHLRGQDEKPEKTAAAVPNHAPQPAPAFGSAEENQPPLRDAPHAATNSSSEKDRTPRSQTSDSFRPTTYGRSNASVDREIPQKREDRGGPAQKEHVGGNTVAALAGGVRDSDREISSSSATSSAKRQAELSFTQSTAGADPPVSYDLNFIDTFDQPSQKKSTQKHVFKLSNQTTSPTADEEDSIAKVLDWFSRSTDSSDWLNGTDDGPEAAKCPDMRAEIMGSEELLSKKDTGDVKSDGRKESVEMKRGQRQSSEGKESQGSKEVIRTQEEVKKDIRERKQSLEVQDSEDVSQSPKLSQLKSFWESSSTYPKIHKSTVYKEPIDLMLDTDEEKVSNTSLSDIHSTELYNEKGIYDQYTSNDADERETKKVIGTQKDMSDSEYGHLNNNNNKELDSVHLGKQQIPASHKNHNDQPFNTDYFKLASSKAADGGDEDILCVTRLSPPPWSESQDVSFAQPKPDFPPRKPSLQEELSKSLPPSQLDIDLKIRDGLDPQKPHTSRNNQHADHKPGGNDVQSTPKSPRHRGGSCEDMRTRDDEDKSLQSGVSQKRKEEVPKDKISSPHSERIKQLKSFWEQERSKPMFYTGKPKTLDGKTSRGPKLTKRFTKSEYDLRSIGNGSGSDDDTKNPVRLDKLSPSLGASRAQFNTLREFWGETTCDSKGSLSSEKPKSPKRKEPISLVPQTPQEPELHRASSVKSTHEKQAGSRATNEGKNNHVMAEASPQRELRRMSKDSGRDGNAGKPAGKEPRSPKSKKDSFSSSSSRGSSLRRATSMFSLSASEEKDQGLFKIDVSPVHSHSRKQSRRYNAGVQDDSEGLTPRARAFVPTDYRHYLGMTDKTRVHAPPAKEEAEDDKARYEFDLDGPPRASTPLGSEERYGKKAIKISQRHQWTNYSSSDTGQESSVSSASETWSTSRTVSTRENDSEDMNPVRKALRRAEARPKTVAKSMEDITAALSPRQERRPDPVVDKRRISDISSIPSPSSSLFSDPEHLKNMSKSVPSFLQKELSGSVMTMYGGDFGNVEVQGNIQFSINYVQRLREFHIFVAECRDLAAVDPKRGRSDPYVKSYLVPDKANLGKRKTSVKKKTLNPAFNEILRYRVRMEYLRTQTLILSVWHNDTFGRNSFLGEVDVDLSTWDFDHTQMNYLPLKARTAPTVAPSNGQGEMRLAIRYLPQIIHSEGLAKEGSTTGEVHIWVKDCKNLPLIRSAIDPYVKCFVLPDTSRKSRQKTRVLRRTADPVFNHTMVYDGIREADLAEACVELTVWDRDRLASNLLGGLRLGSGTGKSYGAVVDWMDSTPYEVVLWDRMVASPNEWVEDVLPLRVLNSAKTAFK